MADRGTDAAAMILRFRMFGLPCVCCGLPVWRIDVHADGVATVHQTSAVSSCVSVTTAYVLRACGAVERPPGSLVRPKWSAA